MKMLYFDWMIGGYYCEQSIYVHDHDNGSLLLATGTIPVSSDFPRALYLWNRFFRIILIYVWQDLPAL